MRATAASERHVEDRRGSARRPGSGAGGEPGAGTSTDDGPGPVSPCSLNGAARRVARGWAGRPPSRHPVRKRSTRLDDHPAGDDERCGHVGGGIWTTARGTDLRSRSSSSAGASTAPEMMPTCPRMPTWRLRTRDGTVRRWARSRAAFATRPGASRSAVLHQLARPRSPASDHDAARRSSSRVTSAARRRARAGTGRDRDALDGHVAGRLVTATTRPGRSFELGDRRRLAPARRRRVVTRDPAGPSCRRYSPDAHGLSVGTGVEGWTPSSPKWRTRAFGDSIVDAIQRNAFLSGVARPSVDGAVRRVSRPDRHGIRIPRSQVDRIRRVRAARPS